MFIKHHKIWHLVILSQHSFMNDQHANIPLVIFRGQSLLGSWQLNSSTTIISKVLVILFLTSLPVYILLPLVLSIVERYVQIHLRLESENH